jgi:polyferredoxin
MAFDWSFFFDLLWSWKYLTILLFAAVGWFLLSRNRPMRRSRLILQVCAFLLFGGVIGLLSPWVAAQYGLHPSPMCAFGKGIAFPALAGTLPAPMVLLMGAIILLAFVGAKGFCGWACPLGAIQEVVGRIPRLKRFRPSFRWTNWFRVLLVAFFFVLLFSARRISYDYFNPFEALHWSHLSHPLVWIPLTTVVAASLFLYRPFCTWICPIGLVSWAVERISLGRIRVGSSCNDCGLCLQKTDCQALPALVARSKIVPDCHGCGDCLDTCPKEAIRYRWGSE